VKKSLFICPGISLSLSLGHNGYEGVDHRRKQKIPPAYSRADDSARFTAIGMMNLRKINQPLMS
jgi:hypothetical protein